MVLITRHVLVRLERDTDVYSARDQARELGAIAGFDRYRLSDIETAVTELCTNALRYGTRGWATLRLDEEAFSATVDDEGPGFGRVASADTGLGIGLAGASRLMDTFTVDPSETGASFTITRRLPHDQAIRSSWLVMAAWRTKPGSEVCGDRWEVAELGDALTVAIADGLGSGVNASRAAEAAVSVVKQRPEDPPRTLLERAGVAAETTRGAVGAIATIDHRRARLRWAGVGDVSGAILPGRSRLATRPGILGRPFHPDELEVPFEPGSCLLLWTDGIQLRLSDPGTVNAGPNAAWLERTVREYGRQTDDGLILVARRAPDGEPR